MRQTDHGKTIYVAATPPKATPKPMSRQEKERQEKRVVYTSTASMKQQEKKKKQMSDIPTVKVKLPFYYNWLVILIWMFIVYSFFMYLKAIFLFLPYTRWWNQNDGKKYNKVFSINLFAQFESFSLGYWFISLFQSEYTKIPSKGVGQFIMTWITNYAKINDEDNMFLLPVNICESIVIGKRSDIDPKDAPDPSSPDFKKDADTGWPTTDTSWQLLFAEWGAPQSYGKPMDSKKWQSRQDNFLWQYYAIDCSAPLVLSFMFNTPENPDTKAVWYPNALCVAMGYDRATQASMGIRGGWWGFCCYGLGTEALSYDTIVNYLYTNELYQPNKDKSCTTGKKAVNWGSAILSGITAVAGIAAFVETGGLGTAAIISGMGTTAISLASNSNCLV